MNENVKQLQGEIDQLSALLALQEARSKALCATLADLMSVLGVQIGEHANPASYLDCRIADEVDERLRHYADENPKMASLMKRLFDQSRQQQQPPPPTGDSE